MLAVLITLTPGRRNKFIDYQKAKVRIAVLLIMDVKTQWNSTLEMLERAYQRRQFTHQWLQNPKYTDYQPLFTTQDEWTIVKYVMEVLRPFPYCTQWMSKRHIVILHHVITVYNDMFDRMHSVMRALANKRTLWKDDLFFAVKLARQKLSKYYAEVTPATGMHLIAAHILDPFRCCNHLESVRREWIIILSTRHHILPKNMRPFWRMWRMNTVPSVDMCRSIDKKAFRATISSTLQQMPDPVNHLLIHMICPVIMQNT